MNESLSAPAFVSNEWCAWRDLNSRLRAETPALRRAGTTFGFGLSHRSSSGDERRRKADKRMVRPTGIEPVSTASEAAGLSVDLRAHVAGESYTAP